MEQEELKKMEAGLNEYYRRHPGKLQATRLNLYLERSRMRYDNMLVVVSQYLTDDEGAEPSVPIVVPAKELGLTWYESRALAMYGTPSLEIVRWLDSHKQEYRNGKPFRYKHSHAIDELLNDDERAVWSMAEGWRWSFKYALAWNSRGHEVEPSIENGRLRVNGKTLYWWLMIEWLARYDKQKAVGLLRGEYQVHHLAPRYLDQRRGNCLAALNLVPKSEHNFMTRAQQKIKKWYAGNYK